MVYFKYKMNASEPKWVIPDDIQYGVNSPGLANL